MQTRLTLRQLEYCVAAADAGSIAEAAERIYVSPFSISSAIAHVESELSVQLFIRHHAQGLSITPAGQEVLRQIRLLLGQAQALYDVADSAQNTVRGPLRVGCLTPLAALVTPELCQGFARAHPQVQVSQIEDHQEGLFERLRQAQIDVAITYDLNVTGSDIAFEPLASLPPYALVAESDPLSRTRTTTLKELAEHPLVLLDLPQSRDYFLSLFHDAGVTPNIVARSHSPEVVRSLVANGAGYTLANVRPRNHLALDGTPLVYVRLRDPLRPMRLGLAWASSQRPRRVVETFMQRCRTVISDEYIPGMTPPGSI